MRTQTPIHLYLSLCQTQPQALSRSFSQAYPSVACLPNSPSMLQVLCKLCHNVSLPLPQTSRCPHTNTSSVGSYKGLNDLINRTHAPRVNRHLCHQHHIVLSFIPIRHHGFNPVHVRAEAPQLHLLALARFDRQRVGIDPLVGRHVSGLRCVRQDVEHRRLINHRQEGNCRNNLLENVADFCLNFCLGLGGRSARCSFIYPERSELSGLTEHRLQVVQPS